MDTEYEYGVMHHRFPEELHRGPMTKDEAKAWVRKTKADGFIPGAFYVVKRPVAKWERVV